MLPIILASGSPRRRELLSMIVSDYTVLTSDVDESAIVGDTPAETAGKLAEAKCLAVAKEHPDSIVIGCDTVVDWNKTIFGKPKDRADAVRMLTALSGTTHKVHTGVCICQGEKKELLVCTSEVEFYPIDPELMQRYVETDEPYDKAGGYAIQGTAALFCKEIRGCYYNIMGFPVSRVAQMLKKFE